MINSLPASSETASSLMIIANNLDPDEASGNMRPHLRSILFDTQILILAKLQMETMMFFSNFDKPKYIF